MLTKVLNSWIQVSDVQLSFGSRSHCKVEGETVDVHLLAVGYSRWTFISSGVQ